jgi:pyridoxal phosphate-dependent aminotransferase EpsN
VGPGDEVLVSTLTFVATANAVLYTGATPVFVDSEPVSWCMDPDLLAEELERRRRANRLPKAVVVVDLYGQCADYDRITDRCRELGVLVVEDAAEAIGAKYKGRPAGSLGDIGVFSFNGNKLITTSGGGAVLTDDEAMARRIRYLATQAREPVLHYEHVEMGFNYRLSNLLAALGRGQLEQLQQKIAERTELHQWYCELFADVPGVEVHREAPWTTANHWLTCVTVDPDVAPFSSLELIESLAAANIEARPAWKPMHLQPAFESADVVGGELAERTFEFSACLPSLRGFVERERLENALAPGCALTPHQAVLGAVAQ